MYIKWEVDDGYVGNRPQKSNICEDEFIDCETEEEVRELLYEWIHEDFVNKIGFYIKGISINELLNYWRESKDKQGSMGDTDND